MAVLDFDIANKFTSTLATCPSWKDTLAQIHPDESCDDLKVFLNLTQVSTASAMPERDYCQKLGYFHFFLKSTRQVQLRED